MKKIALFVLGFLFLFFVWPLQHEYRDKTDLSFSLDNNLSTLINVETQEQFCKDNQVEGVPVVGNLEQNSVKFFIEKKEAEVLQEPEVLVIEKKEAEVLQEPEILVIEKKEAEVLQEPEVLVIEQKEAVAGKFENMGIDSCKACESSCKACESGFLSCDKHGDNNKVLKPSILFLDNKYNHALVQDLVKNCGSKKWVISGVFSGSLEFDAFNNRGKKVCLSNFLFGDFKIMDIFLLSKLSSDNKLYLEDADLPVNISQLLKNSKQDQYLAYIAPFNVEIEAENSEQRFDFGGIYRFPIGKSERVVCSLGFNIPIERRLHIMDLDLVGLDMTKCGFTQEQINFVLDDFHSNFIDFTDFFRQVVLEPKGLNFNERQQKIGLGDASVFAEFDFNRLTKHVDGLQFGLELMAPTAGCKGKFKGCDVWQVVLGNGGAWQFGLSSNILFKTSKNYFNPSATLSGRFSSEFYGCKRVAMFKENISDTPVMAKNVPNLIAPVFQDHFVRKFAQYDSCVHDFADQAVGVKTKFGSELLFSLGNYFYNVFRENFRLALFYNLMYKSRDKVCACCNGACENNGQNVQQNGRYNTCALEKFTNMNAQQFSWHLAYVSETGIEVNIGSKHVFAGKNCPQTNSILACLIANF